MPKFYIKDLTGMNRVLNPLLIKSGDFKLVHNYNSDVASAKIKRKGYETFLNNPDSLEVYNLIEERLSSGRFVLRVSGTSIYKYAFTGSTWGSAVKTGIGYVANQSQITGDATQTDNKMDATTDYLAQGFKVDTTANVGYVNVLLKQTGTTGNLTLRIETDNAGSASGTLADANATATITATDVSTSATWITVKFATAFSLTADTQYHLVLRPSATADGSNYIQWVGTTSNLYSNGVLKLSANSGTSYTACASTLDAGFIVYSQTKTRMGHAVLSNLLLLGNGGDYTMKYDGVTFTDMTAAPRCKYWLTYKGRVYGFGVDYNKSRGFFSKTGDLTSWTNTPADATTGNSFDVDLDSNGDIVGAEVINDRIIVHKERGSYRLIPDDYGRVAEILPIPTSKTSTSHWAIQQVNGKSYYPARDATYVHTGTTPGMVSFSVKDLFEGITDSNRTSLVAGQWKNHFYLSAYGNITEDARLGGGVARTFTNAVLVFNTLLNEWYIYTLGHKPTAFATFLDTSSTENLYFGDNSGNTFKFGVGNLDGTLPIHGEIEIWPMYLGSFDIRKDIDYLSVLADMGNEAQVFYKFDKDDWQPLGDVKGDFSSKFIADFGAERKNVSFKIVDSSTTKESVIYGFAINAQGWDQEQDTEGMQDV